MIFWKTKDNSFKVKEDIKNTLSELFNEMSSKGYNRIGVNIAEISKEDADSQRPGGWINVTPYYPSELFVSDEVSLIKDKKSYQIASLVLGEVPGVVNYPSPGFECINRIRLFPLLPKMDDSSPFYYFSNPVHYSLDDAVNVIVDSGVTSSELRNGFIKGVNEYKRISSELFSRSGVYDSLKKLEQKDTYSDKVFGDLVNRTK
jgi:hypothetical protein